MSHLVVVVMAVVLLVTSRCVVMATEDVEELEAGGFCGDDAASEVSSSLRLDPRWRCAVHKAQCSVRQNPDSCECDASATNDTEVASVKVASPPPYGPPRLFCRSLSTVVWRWEAAMEAEAYVVSVRQEGDGDGHWLQHSLVLANNFTFEEALNVSSRPDLRFQVRVQGISSLGQWALPCTSTWTSLLNATYVPPATNMTILDDFMFSGKRVNVTVEWEPAADDMSCDYKIVHWAPYDKWLVENVVEMELHMTHQVILPNLKFNTTYDIKLYSVHLGQNGKDYELSDEYDYTFTTPSCLELWQNNLTICSPPPPVSLTIHFLDIGENSYALNVTWKHGYIVPEEYIVTLHHLNDNITEERRLCGNITSTQFRGIKYLTYYGVAVRAVSEGGQSAQLTTIEKISDPIKLEGSGLVNTSSRPWKIIVPVIISIFLLGMAMIFILYKKLLKKKVEVSLGKECLQKTDIEQPQESNDEPSSSSTIYYDDEWEIPPHRLVIGDVLGSGFFGVVHKGLLEGQSKQDLLQEVAVKMLRENPTSEDIQQFHREITMMKSVGKHPHIVSIIGCCTCSGPMRLIVEYCAVGDLQGYLRKYGEYLQDLNSTREKLSQRVQYAELLISDSSTNDIEDADVDAEPKVVLNQMYFEEDLEKLEESNSLQPSDLLSFARQIAMGMEFLAGNRIVHRDLAARNVLLSSNKTVKISDFGLSRDLYEQNVYHKRGQGKVPLKWMALESLIYQIYTTQSDVWSFGILLWEIVTLGGMPYPSTSAERLFQLLKKGYRMECPSNCSQELYEVMLSCWKAKPKDRPTFTDLRNKLDSLLESSTPQQYLNLDVDGPEIVAKDLVIRYTNLPGKARV